MTGAERIFKAVGNALYDTVMMIHVIIHLLKFVTYNTKSELPSMDFG